MSKCNLVISITTISNRQAKHTEYCHCKQLPVMIQNVFGYVWFKCLNNCRRWCVGKILLTDRQMHRQTQSLNYSEIFCANKKEQIYITLMSDLGIHTVYTTSSL